ncbi:MAG: response regulator [Pyrinomonadaceae bacterium]
MSIIPSTENLPNPAADMQKPLVMVMSREQDTRVLFRTLLEIWSYRVEEVEDLEDLIFAAERTRPSLILMDTWLPFVDNMTKMQQMRKCDALKSLPIVLLSGHSQPRFRNLALSLGANDFLVKPVDFDLLEASLEKNIKRDGKAGGGNVL